MRFLRVPAEFPRSTLDELTEFAKQWGAKGLAYIVYGEDGEARSPILKFLSEAEQAAFKSEPGTTVLFAADTYEKTSRVLGALRLELANRLGLIDEAKQAWLWVTDFPMFEWDEDEQRYGAKHHPFTRPAAEWVDRFDEDPANAIAHAYDLIGNGNELGGGSFRIHEADLQARAFALLNLTPEQQREKFGFLLDALAMGAPPHGGIAFGIDRMAMVLAKEPNLRDVIAFPKNQAGRRPDVGRADRGRAAAAEGARDQARGRREAGFRRGLSRRRGGYSRPRRRGPGRGPPGPTAMSVANLGQHPEEALEQCGNVARFGSWSRRSSSARWRPRSWWPISIRSGSPG